MKSRNDPRHQRREHLVQQLFEWEFRKHEISPTVLQEIVPHIEELDKYIQESAPQWPLSQIAAVDLAILRLALWELFYEEKRPSEKVILDECIELAKEYGGETSPAFVNGVLGGVLKKHEDKLSPLGEEEAALAVEKPIEDSPSEVDNS
jgi:transcription antitermination protein NusB